MEGNSEVSPHRLAVWEFVRDIGRWVTIADIEQATGIKARTVRHHARNLAELGLFERVDVFPGARFRVALDPQKQNPAELARLAQAREVFGEAAQ